MLKGLPEDDFSYFCLEEISLILEPYLYTFLELSFLSGITLNVLRCLSMDFLSTICKLSGSLTIKLPDIPLDSMELFENFLDWILSIDLKLNIPELDIRLINLAMSFLWAILRSNEGRARMACYLGWSIPKV